MRPIVAGRVQDGGVEQTPDRVRRRIDEVFGDVLPSTTSDERDEGGERTAASSDDEMLANRPPHHDRD
jgi:hypothetical protein